MTDAAPASWPTGAPHLYRFRSCRALLEGFGELERQEIYFAPPDQLNDPMEGFRDLFWRGDQVVWRNFLRHYARCLTIAAGIARLMGDDLSVPRCFDHVYASLHAPPTPAHRDACNAVADAFMQLPHIAALAQDLGRREDPVRPDELGYILRGIHLDALKLAARNPLSGFSKEAAFHETLEQASPAAPFRLRTTAFGVPHASVREALHEESTRIALQMRLVSLLERSGRANQAMPTFLLIDFPYNYIAALDRLLYPDWSVACFTASPANAAMWGIYADGHKGACLKFAAGDDSARPALELFRPVGLSGGRDRTRTDFSWMKHPAPAVEYVQAFPETDFFSSLGRVTTPALHRDWLSDPELGRSSVADQLHEGGDEADWRNRYWRAFERNNLLKTRHWAHEAEHRVIHASGVIDLADPAQRKLKYRFGDLVGIYFGARTDDHDILRILKIVQTKCVDENRKDFELYRASYVRTTGEMDFDRLSLVEKSLFG